MHVSLVNTCILYSVAQLMTCSHNDALMTHSSFQLLVIRGCVSLQCFGNVLYILLDFDSFYLPFKVLNFFYLCVCVFCVWRKPVHGEIACHSSSIVIVIHHFSSCHSYWYLFGNILVYFKRLSKQFVCNKAGAPFKRLVKYPLPITAGKILQHQESGGVRGQALQPSEMHGSVTYIQVYITGVGGASRNVGQQTYSGSYLYRGDMNGQ